MGKSYNSTTVDAPVTAGNASFVEWESTYDSADAVAVGTLCNPTCQALLAALRAHCAHSVSGHFLPGPVSPAR